MVVGLWYDSDAALGSPAEEDLSRSCRVQVDLGETNIRCNVLTLLVLRSNSGYTLMFKKTANVLVHIELDETLGPKGRVSSHSYSESLAECDKWFLSQVWMVLDLKNTDRVLGVALNVDYKGTLSVTIFILLL